ncbi:MAG: histidine kinase dimerization/phospho-acceptor domain-containing protein, partial [Chloroflexota bacterium]
VIARRSEAEQANRAKDDFLGNAAHELRTPLTSLMGNLELAASRVTRAISARGAGGDGAEAAATLASLQDLHQRAHLQIDRLARLVNDILDASRVQGGKLEMRLAPADLTAHIRSTLADLRYLIGKRPLKIELPGDRPVQVLADIDRNGATFWFTLPLAGAGATLPPPATR